MPSFQLESAARRGYLRPAMTYWLAWLVLVALLLPGAGLLYQTLGERRDRRRFPPPGRMVDAGGHRLHLLRRGEGTPTVVFGASNDGMFASYSGQTRQANLAVSLDTHYVIIGDYTSGSSLAKLEIWNSSGSIGTDSYTQTAGIGQLDDSRMVLGRSQQWTAGATETYGNFELFGVALYNRVLSAAERTSEVARWGAW